MHPPPPPPRRSLSPPGTYGEHPLVPEGMARLFRAGPPVGVPINPDIPEWILQAPEFQQTVNATGRWFGDSLEEIQMYRGEHPNHPVTYLDVPIDEYEQYRVRNLPRDMPDGMDPQLFSRRQSNEFFLPKDAARKAIPYPGNPGTSGIVSQSPPGVAGGGYPQIPKPVYKKNWKQHKATMAKPKPKPLNHHLRRLGQSAKNVISGLPKMGFGFVDYGLTGMNVATEIMAPWPERKPDQNYWNYQKELFASSPAAQMLRKPANDILGQWTKHAASDTRQRGQPVQKNLLHRYLEPTLHKSRPNPQQRNMPTLPPNVMSTLKP